MKINLVIMRNVVMYEIKTPSIVLDRRLEMGPALIIKLDPRKIMIMTLNH